MKSTSSLPSVSTKILYRSTVKINEYLITTEDSQEIELQMINKNEIEFTPGTREVNYMPRVSPVLAIEFNKKKHQVLFSWDEFETYSLIQVCIIIIIR